MQIPLNTVLQAGHAKVALTCPLHAWKGRAWERAKGQGRDKRRDTVDDAAVNVAYTYGHHSCHHEMEGGLFRLCGTSCMQHSCEEILNYGFPCARASKREDEAYYLDDQ